MKTCKDLIEINGKSFKLFLKSKEIDEIVSSLAKKINSDYKDKEIVFLIVLKGSIFFATDLLKKIKVPCRIEPIFARSYGNEMHSSGVVNINFNDLSLKSKNVVIIEDIVDSGLTLQSIINKLKKLEPESIEAAAFISKPDQRTVEVKVKYTGIETGPEFLVGYGMDYAEQGRNLDCLYILDNA